MDSSSASQHHHQEMSSQTLESMLVCTQTQQPEKKAKPAEQAQKCPRCDSTNTKFCYYNNYSLSQPRYFCKSCRRYWTKGGTLRNVPVGGGCRKNKRSPSSKIRGQDQAVVTTPNNTLLSPYDSSDLSLALARLQKQTNGHHFGFDHENMDQHLSMFDALRGGFLENPQINCFNNSLYYGMNNGNDHVENGGEEMGLTYEDNIGISPTTTTVKQEMCNGRSGGGEGRVLWGFPWQFNGEGNNIGDIDPSRQSNWNNGFGSSWHGLLNSPLM